VFACDAVTGLGREFVAGANGGRELEGGRGSRSGLSSILLLTFTALLLIGPVAGARAAADAFSWAAPVLIDHQAPFGASSSLVGMSCVSRSLCAAVDDSGNAVLTTDPTAPQATWSASADIDGSEALEAISCPSIALCVAVDGRGDAVLTTDPTAAEPSWSASADIDGSEALEAISCPSIALCVAVDGRGDAVLTTDPTAPHPSWSAPADIDGGDALEGVSCSSTSLCVAVGGGGDAVISDDPAGGAGTWTTAVADPARYVCGALFSCPAALEGVSCLSSSLCVAVDSAGDAVVTDDPMAAQPTWSAPASIAGGLDAVSCASTSLCVALNNAGQVVVSTDPTAAQPDWSPPASIASNSSSGETPVALSCSSVTLCAAVYDHGNGFISTDPSTADPSWSEAPIDISGTDDLDAISCPSKVLCMTIDSSGHRNLSSRLRRLVGEFSEQPPCSRAC
jgi:hypothetical protein